MDKISLMIETSAGSYTALNQGSHSIRHIPFQTSIQKIWNTVSQKGIVLRLPHKSTLTAQQFEFLMYCLCDPEMGADETSVISWKSWRHRLGVDAYLHRAKEVGYVLGLRIGNALLWDDGSFSLIRPEEA